MLGWIILNDHLNDLDLNDLQQVEIVKGPSSLLYANGTIGGIINVVDDCISTLDYEDPKFNLGYESQSVNDGDSKYFNYKTMFAGFNVNVGHKKINFGNYDVPNGAILHSEEHHEEDHDEDHHDEDMHEEDLGYLNNSDYANKNLSLIGEKFWTSKEIIEFPMKINENQ